MEKWLEDEMRTRLHALEKEASTPLAEFVAGDPGKHVQTLIPTPEWKALAKEASQRGVSLSLMMRIAARQHIAWLRARDSTS